MKAVNVNVTQDSVLDSLPYWLYTSNLPGIENQTIPIFIDDTMSVDGYDYHEATWKLQLSFMKSATGLENRKRSSYKLTVYYRNKKVPYLPVRINNTRIPYTYEAKYCNVNVIL